MTLFCSDIDGTLLDPSRSISARTAAAIRSTISTGHSFVLCSSRMPQSMRILQAAYRGRGTPMIAYNGALILNGPERIASENRISHEAADSVYRAAEALEVHASYYCSDSWYAWAEDHWCDTEINNTRVLPAQQSTAEWLDSGGLKRGLPHKIMVMGEAEKVDRLEQMVRDRSVHGVVCYRSKETYLEIGSASCSKGTALVALASFLGVPIGETVFFGDSYNDLSAFEVAGTAVAVANARADVIEAADSVTLASIEEGVACYLESVL